MEILRAVLLAVPVCLWLSGCSRSVPEQTEFTMGEKVKVGSVVYSVIDSTWKGQLGEGYKIRTPNQRFLLLTVSVTNGGGGDVSIPLLQVEGANGQMFQELPNG